jgi:outer membrane immunogenic protein
VVVPDKTIMPDRREIDARECGGWIMRNVGYGGFVACALVVIAPLTCSMPASAADMPVKAPPAPAAAYDWTGFYIGANVGYSVGRNHASEILADSGGSPITSQSFTLAPAGWLGGGQIGYNWQAAPHWVLGVEADWQWTGGKDSVCISACLVDFLTVEQRLRWLATLRARLGYARDGWLWYVTGGGAWGHVTETDALFFFTPGTATSSRTKGGWTIGGGVETALAGAWTAKLEYLYVGIGSTTDILAGVVNPGGTATETITKNERDHIFRVGLNYRFGGIAAASPVYAAKSPAAIYKAPPPPAVAYNWTGFYLGGNVGYSVGRNHSSESQVAADNSSQSFTLGPAGGLAGGQIGYNWQPAANWVFGVEADWQGTGQKDSVCLFVCDPFNGLTVQQKLDWVATLRARIGYARDGWLWYVTGGGAWGRVTESDVLLLSGMATTARFAHTNSGWSAGSGIETVLAGNWTAKFEYLYVDLGDTRDTFAFCPISPLCGSETVTKQVRDHIFRVGLNYRFGGPLVARH